jgi:hypothetical protein
MENNTNNRNNTHTAGAMNTPDPLVPAENNIDLPEEIDEDDAIHSKKEKPSEENKQQDGDDAVHKNYKPAPDSLHENDEHDPDDAVHGK